MEVPDKVGRALARPQKCHIRKGVEIYLRSAKKNLTTTLLQKKLVRI